MKDLVLDASVAAKWLFLEKESEHAERLIEEITFFFVPLLFPIEMDSIITKRVRRKELDVSQAGEKREQVRKLPYKVTWTENINKLSFELAISLPITFYDASYLAVAIENHAVLITADRRLAKVISRTSFNNYIICLPNFSGFIFP